MKVCKYIIIDKIQKKELPNATFPGPMQCQSQNVTAKVPITLETLGIF